MNDPLIDVPVENLLRVEQLLSHRDDLQRRFEELGNTYADQEDYDRLFVEMDRVNRELRSLGYVRR